MYTKREICHLSKQTDKALKLIKSDWKFLFCVLVIDRKLFGFAINRIFYDLMKIENSMERWILYCVCEIFIVLFWGSSVDCNESFCNLFQTQAFILHNLKERKKCAKNEGKYRFSNANSNKFV